MTGLAVKFGLDAMFGGLWGKVKAFGSFAARYPWQVALALSVAVGALGWHLEHRGQAASRQVQAKVDQATTAAAQQSASDAINTVTHEITREHDIERTVINAQSAVQGANDGAGAYDAARAGLCDISANLCPAAAMQRADPGRLAPAHP